MRRLRLSITPYFARLHSKEVQQPLLNIPTYLRILAFIHNNLKTQSAYQPESDVSSFTFYHEKQLPTLEKQKSACVYFAKTEGEWEYMVVPEKKELSVNVKKLSNTPTQKNAFQILEGLKAIGNLPKKCKNELISALFLPYKKELKFAQSEASNACISFIRYFNTGQSEIKTVVSISGAASSRPALTQAARFAIQQDNRSVLTNDLTLTEILHLGMIRFSFLDSMSNKSEIPSEEFGRKICAEPKFVFHLMGVVKALDAGMSVKILDARNYTTTYSESGILALAEVEPCKSNCAHLKEQYEKIITEIVSYSLITSSIQTSKQAAIMLWMLNERSALMMDMFTQLYTAIKADELTAPELTKTLSNTIKQSPIVVEEKAHSEDVSHQYDFFMGMLVSVGNAFFTCQHSASNIDFTNGLMKLLLNFYQDNSNTSLTTPSLKKGSLFNQSKHQTKSVPQVAGVNSGLEPSPAVAILH